MQQEISDYLRQSHNNRRPQGKQDRNFAFLLTFIGELFIQGYRLIQNYGSILIFSLMEFQFTDNQAIKMEREQTEIPTRFKILLWEMKVQNILGNAKNRREKFNKMSMIGNLLGQVQYDIIYLQECRYSVVQKEMLQNNGLPVCLLYFKKIKWVDYKNGLVPMCNKKQGQQLHKLIQIFVKGAGEGRNLEQIRILQNKHKFSYNLFKIINTICYIIGKQMLQNDFQSMASQKWMRKFTEKKFKRYDLVLRNQQRSLIIDWKFSNKTAQQKAKFHKTKKKNQIYCQLARKDFKNQVQLRFYSISRATQNNYYHQFTFANFQEQKSTIDLEIIKTYYNKISISDSESDSFYELNPERQLMINNNPTDCIEIISSEEIQSLEDQVQIIESDDVKFFKSNQVNKSERKQMKQQNINVQHITRSKTQKSTEKASKIQRKNNKIARKKQLRFPIQVLEIQSD